MKITGKLKMKSGFALLKQKVANNKLSAAFLDRLSNPELQDPKLQFDRVLSQRIASYSPKATGKPEGDVDPRWPILNRLIDTIPSCLFRLVLDWNSVAGETRSGRDLLLGILSSLVWQDPGLQPHIDAFIADIDPTTDIKALNAQLIQKIEGDSPVPKKVFTDFLAMTHPLIKLIDRNDLTERIENLYIFEALFQFLLTYYFDLLIHADTDTVTGYVHVIFLRLFAGLKRQEMQIWELHPEKQGMRQVLLDIIAADKPDQRHPLLRQTAFKSIELYNPLFYPETNGNTGEFVNRYNQRLNAFMSLSIMSTTLFLDTLLLVKGKQPVKQLVERLFAENYQKFSQLQVFLDDGKHKAAHNVLFDLLELVAEQKPSLENIVSEPESDESGGLSLDQVLEHLKQRIITVYERVRQKETLTPDQISDYLTRISGDIAESLFFNTLEKTGINAFVERIEPEIKEITALGMLANAEKEAFREQLCQQAEIFAKENRNGKTEEVNEEPPTTEPKEDPFLTQEIIPVGFEKGAPRVSVKAFFSFPFKGMDEKRDNPHGQHLEYLMEAVNRSAMDQLHLDEIKSRLSELPRPTYRKTYDIFPLNIYDETVLLVVFSLWRNQALDRLLTE